MYFLVKRTHNLRTNFSFRVSPTYVIAFDVVKEEYDKLVNVKNSKVVDCCPPDYSDPDCNWYVVEATGNGEKLTEWFILEHEECNAKYAVFTYARADGCRLYGLCNSESTLKDLENKAINTYRRVYPDKDDLINEEVAVKHVRLY